MALVFSDIGCTDSKAHQNHTRTNASAHAHSYVRTYVLTAQDPRRNYSSLAMKVKRLEELKGGGGGNRVSSSEGHVIAGVKTSHSRRPERREGQSLALAAAVGCHW